MNISLYAFKKINYLTDSAVSKINLNSDNYKLSTFQKDYALQWTRRTIDIISLQMENSFNSLTDNIIEDLNKEGERIQQEHLASGQCNKLCLTPHNPQSEL